MRIALTYTLCCLLLGGIARSQAGPGKIRAEKENHHFIVGASGNLPFRTVVQTFHRQLPGDPAGVYTTCMTGTGLSAAAGGVWAEDLWIGIWDSRTGKITSTTQASALNTTGTEFGLSLDRTGLHAVFDRAGGPCYSKRSAVSLPFPASVPILDAGTARVWTGGSWIDPSIGRVLGKLKIFYASGSAIWMDDFDVSNPVQPRLGGNPVKVAEAKTAGHEPNSPTPIHGADGDVEGLWMANLAGSDNDMVFSDDLDPQTPWSVVVDTLGWIHNGGVAGGRLSYAGSGLAWDLDVAWLLGDTESLGGRVDVTAAMPLGPAQSGTTLVIMSTGVRSPLTLAGIGGFFGLKAAVIIPIGSILHQDATQRGSFSFIVPNDARLKSQRFALQGISILNATAKLTFTNTAHLVVR